MSTPRSGSTLERMVRFALWMNTRRGQRTSIKRIQCEFGVAESTAMAMRRAWLDGSHTPIPPCVGEKMADVAHDHYRQELDR